VLIEIWSDFVCPWCYIGKRRLEAALKQFEHADDVDIIWRSYQLDPSVAPGATGDMHEYLRRKFGDAERVRAMTDHVTAVAAGDGLEYHLDRAKVANTFDAHRLAHLARRHGAGPALHERLMSAHLVEGENLGEHDTLVRLAGDVGVPADESRRVLASDEFADDVRAEIREAAQLGANGVPFFVLGRTHGVAGAQPVETFLGALREAYSRAAAPAN